MQHMIYHLAQLKSNPTATKVWYDLFWNNYASIAIVWDLICQLNVNKVERIQRLVARFIYNDFSWHSSVSACLICYTCLIQLAIPSYLSFHIKLCMNQCMDITPPASYLRPISRDTLGHPLKYIQLPTNYLPALMHINTPFFHQKLKSGTIY